MKTTVRNFILCAILVTCTIAGAQTTLRQYLSGTGKDSTVAWNFFCTAGRNSGNPTTIPVPSNWELKGFGNYTYQTEPAQPEQGLYSYTFSVPQSWQGKAVNIVFDGVMTDADVTINGTSAGVKHQGGFYRFRYNISKLLRYDTLNTLAVTVSRSSSEPSVNNAERHGDYWNFSGIYRPVYLEAFPIRHITRFAIHAQTSGAFTAQVLLDSITSPMQLVAKIVSATGAEVANQVVNISALQSSAQINASVASPLLWTAETPNRYTLELSLKSGDTVVHSVSQKFGFRTIEVRTGNGIFVNGQKVKFKGVCRHSFWPTEGRTLNRSISLADVQLIQSMNMNAVRMSHYPPDEHFLDVCDSLGLYVLDELAGWQASYATTVGKKLVEETVTRDVNHPSIIFWDNGNEGGWNTALDTCFPFWDIQKRTVLHPWATFNAINTQHYPTYSGVQAALGGSTIYMPTEFLHGLYDGGAGSGLYDYWNLMYNSPLCAGGFIWALLDEAVVRTDQGNILDARVNLAPDGIVGPYREKKGSYATIKNVWSPVYIDMDTLPASFSGTIPVQNRYDFIGLDKCSFTWKLGSSDFFTGDTGIAIGQTGSCTAPVIAPHAIGTLNLSLPSNWKTYDVLQLTAYNPDGKLICTWSWMLHSAQQICSSIVDTASTALVTCTQGSASILVTAGTMEYVFNKKGGKLTAVRKSGKDISFTADSLLLVGGAMADTVVVTQRSSAVSLVVKSADTASSIQWTIYGNGLCKLSYKYPLSGTYAFHGVTFNYPEANVRSAQWLGKGPYHVWRNRMKGGTDNVWQQAYNNGTPGTSWIYPEFKGYFADVKWMRLLTSEDTITIINDTPATFVRLFTPQMGTTPLNAIAAFPRGDISLLHSIAPMGNKFHSADNTGPQGTLVTENKIVTGSSYLYFGKLQKVSAIAPVKDTVIKVAQQVPVATSTTPASAAISLRHRGKDAVTIDFFVPTESNITLNLSDILGRKSITLYKQRTGTGWHSFEFSSANASIPRGIYIVQLVSNGRTLVTRTLGAY